ncbi:hypothetical protein SAMD00019534_008290 [Acytostelium subglobosum LB1]|uniref:hypothetical protein n=1 Tax=Acytostelium subglobosum LB1 TaxID=1410327 RepID=UPI000645193F|nr:hypothetical protein SAMD00019534_008290 [Acytostelium subglobosum LB1]GAM17654.1 hypothetical protein SAMD00019534_008290 [Acytostelium subglobosum LB1]|eukprot:XP_012758250.1 hypothetical protein SAMD00019534_008290 [Acytostelium subglobosum LB1]
MYEVEDVIERSLAFKYTFTVPSEQQIDRLKVGDLVKLIFREDPSSEQQQQQQGSTDATLNQSCIQVDAPHASSSTSFSNPSATNNNNNNNSSSVINQSTTLSSTTQQQQQQPNNNNNNDTNNECFIERMWVSITHIDDGHKTFKGTLDNSPYKMRTLTLGDTVSFARNHILAIYDQPNESSFLTEEQRIFTSQFCLVSRMALDKNRQVGYMFREDPIKTIANDSGWRIFQGDESDEYLANHANFQTVSLASVLNQDDTFIHLLHYPPDSCFEKDDNSKEWRKIKDE